MNNFDDKKLPFDPKDLDLPASHLGREQSVGSVLDFLLESLSISGPTERALRELFEVVDAMPHVNDYLEEEAVQQLVDRYPEIYIIVRLGYAARVFDSHAKFKSAVSRFLNDDKSHYRSSEMRRRYKDLTALNEYAKKYQLFPSRVNAVDSAVDSQVPAWAAALIDQQQLNPNNSLVRFDGQRLGEIILQIAREFSSRRSDRLKTQDFVDLCEVFLVQVQQERSQRAIIASGGTAADETLSKTLAETAGAKYWMPDKSEFKGIPKVLSEPYKAGEPLYRLLIAMLQQMTEAIADAEHPAHQLCVELMTVLNSFQIPEINSTEEAKAQPFNYQLVHGLALRDFESLGNYQDFVINLNNLAKTEGPNQAWYKAFLDYISYVSELFRYHIVFLSDRIETAVFDLQKTPSTDINLDESLNYLLSKSGSRDLTVLVDEETVPSEQLGVRAENYSSYLHARKVSADSYIINTELILIGYEAANTEDRRKQGLTKFRFQVRISEGETIAQLPVIDSHNATPEMQRAAIEFTKRIIAWAELEAREEEEQQKTTGKKIDITYFPSSMKSGTREQRKADYEAAKSQSVPTDTRPEKSSPKPLESLSVSATEEEAVSKFLPMEIVVTPSMQREMEKRKKGSAARVYSEADEFLTRYNSAKGSEKPGHGHQLEDVYGPDGQNVWRFKATYNTRCIVVDLGGGRALLVSANNHDDAYGGAAEMSKWVARELKKYEQEVGE